MASREFKYKYTRLLGLDRGLPRNSAVHQRTNPRLFIYIKKEGEFKHKKAKKNFHFMFDLNYLFQTFDRAH